MTDSSSSSSSPSPSSPSPASSPSTTSSLSGDNSTFHDGFAGRPRLGVLQPLFSVRTARGWGVGEIGDLGPFARWAGGVGLHVVQLLPVNELTEGESSPYSAASAFALDPVYLSLDDVEDFAAAGGRAALGDAGRAALERLNDRAGVDWSGVRALKHTAIERAFSFFYDHEWRTGSTRARALTAFMAEHAAWLPDYALFRVLHDRWHTAWWQWPAAIAARDPAALAAARAEHERAILRRCFVEWQLTEQWTRARAAARAAGVALKGDLPFMVAADSADVWSRPHEFRRDRSVGVPPDAFSATGQDWGLPAHDWDVMRASGFPWMTDRAARAGALYDLFRVDHVIGLFRTYSRPVAAPGAPPAAGGSFYPAAEPEQIALGNAVLDIFKRHGEVVAEDLGFVPPFLPAALQRLDIPGYRVLRWERDDQGRFRDPARYPLLSVATTGTHDVEPIATWYDALGSDEKRAFLALPGLQHLPASGDFDGAVRDAILGVVARSGAGLAIFPFQDLLGSRDRINVPGTVAPSNWTTRMPIDLAALDADADLRARLGRLTFERESRQSKP